MTPLFLFLSTLVVSSLLYYVLVGRKSKEPKGLAPLPPGPRGLPVLGNLLQLGARPHQTMQALAKDYGPLFRLRLGSVDVIVAGSASVATEFLKVHDVNFSDRLRCISAENLAFNHEARLGFSSSYPINFHKNIC